MREVNVPGLRDLCGLCASVLNHRRSFPRRPHTRNARDHEPVPGYADR
jgi:hypothetical protein